MRLAAHQLEALVRHLAIAVDEATQCHFCGEYARAHLPLCPTRKESYMSQYRVVFAIPKDSTDGPHQVVFLEAPDMIEAMARVSVQHAPCQVLSCRLEGPAFTTEEQREQLIRALRPLLSVCRGLLDNGTPLLTHEMRVGLEGMCADAVAALKGAGVIR